MLTVAPEWTVGRLIAARRDASGLLRAAATPRLMQAYAWLEISAHDLVNRHSRA